MRRIFFRLHKQNPFSWPRCLPILFSDDGHQLFRCAFKCAGESHVSWWICQQLFQQFAPVDQLSVTQVHTVQVQDRMRSKTASTPVWIRNTEDPERMVFPP